MKRWGAVLLLTLCMLPVSAARIEVPYLTGRVTDNAELLNPETRARLTQALEAHERAHGNQVAVLTVPSIGDASIEDYAHTVFNAWGLGQKGRNNGVLLVVAPTERRMRIEVGYGLEGTLTDALASRIIRHRLTPYFKSGDFNRGIEEGVHSILAVLEGRDPGLAAAPASVPSPSSAGSDSLFKGPDLSLPERILIGGFVFGIIGLFTFIGLITPGVGWFLYFFLIPFWAMFPIIVLGVTGALILFGIYLAGFPIAKLMIGRSGWYRKAASDLKSKGTARIGGFVLGGSSRSSGSSWSSGGSSGGGFSGGGGSSGGGGASGSW